MRMPYQPVEVISCVFRGRIDIKIKISNHQFEGIHRRRNTIMGVKVNIQKEPAIEDYAQQRTESL